MGATLKNLAMCMILCLLLFMHCGIFDTDTDNENEKKETAVYLTCTFTVAGQIQTDDPWTTGNTSVNEWAKPMYYIWFDMTQVKVALEK